MKKVFTILAASLILGICIIIAAKQLSPNRSSVAVRGLCEREVPADLAIYPVVFKETGDNLVQLYNTVDQKNKTIVAFLKKNGFEEKEITVAVPKISDNYAQGYNNGARSRYIITSVITVYTSKVQQVLNMQSQQGELVEQGIAVGAGDEWQYPVTFAFEGLNNIKPEMIEEANKNAREAAEQFAKDCDSRVGKIQNATQGLFTIGDRDANTPHIKKVRVVTNVTYSLK